LAPVKHKEVYQPIIDFAWAPRTSVAGMFAACPGGIILHGSRSGRSWSTQDEYESTVNYAEGGAAGLGWNATIGDDTLAIHIPLDSWGWNARAASKQYLAVEFAQGTASCPISDGQVRAFVYFYQMAKKEWPALPLRLPTHAELDSSGATGHYDGKSDVFPVNDPRTEDLRKRIVKRLGEMADA
jgi:hypothetical protein